MKIICTKSNLVKGVNIVSKAVPSKTTMPILECILIDATTDIIKLTANDMELGIDTIIEGDIIQKGVIAIDAKIFSEIVRKLPDNEITIESDSNLQTMMLLLKQNLTIRRLLLVKKRNLISQPSQEMIFLIFRRLNVKILLLFPSLL